MKHELSFPNKTRISYEILAYLSEHPKAQDTLAGITHWWLLERRIDYQSSLVKEALADLVKQGLISEWKKHDVETRYGINQQRINVLLDIPPMR